MDISRINSGKVELRTEHMNISAAIVAAAETSLPHIELARHQLVTRVPDEMLMVVADPTRLAQILSNLLINAAKYTPAGGRIDLCAWREGEEGVVTVTDTGIGIPETALPRVFDMFSQVSNDIARSKGGLGIGLSLVKRLVELHGGSVSAASPGIGQGSTFGIRLPLVPHPVEGHAAPPSSKSNRSNSANSHPTYSILVADDNTDAAETLAAILRLSGHALHVAADGEQAIALAHGVMPDIAFIDIGMPGKDGHGVAREIRQSRALDSTILVALTGWGTPTDRTLSREAGFDYHLTKPVAIGDIANILKAMPA